MSRALAVLTASAMLLALAACATAPSTGRGLSAADNEAKVTAQRVGDGM
jgi:hypothetical protein